MYFEYVNIFSGSKYTNNTVSTKQRLKNNQSTVKECILINFGCWFVSTCMDSNAAHTSQCLKTAIVQHTIAPTQSDRQLTQCIDNKTFLENNAASRSIFS